MTRADAVIVGGGPAGSTCARALRRAGWDVLVVDRARFPRDKVCAGWVTPEVFSALELSPGEYSAAGLTLERISAFRTGVIGSGTVETRYPRVVSYGILRREFDHFLLQRAGVRVIEGTPVETLRRTASAWIINDSFEAPVVIGAGGHFCPVARQLRGGGADAAQPVVAKEAEFVAAGRRPDSPSLFFCRDLEGYGWCMPKGDYVNVGIGRRDSRDFNAHVKDFMAFLEAHGINARGDDVRWHGHAYFAAGAGRRPLIGSGMLLIGDAAGLAYPESGEGIRPSIESGLLAARTLIAAQGRYEPADLRSYDETIRTLHPAAPPRAAVSRAVSALIAPVLLRSRAFSRHVLLDKWFLRSARPVERRDRTAN
jgi:geranylgeranyl reductase family protein